MSFSMLISKLTHILTIFNSHFFQGSLLGPTLLGPGCREGRRGDQPRGDRARYGQRAAKGRMQHFLGKPCGQPEENGGLMGFNGV